MTLDKLKIGRMSCNPAIGGIGKSHLAKEVDALGGYMCEATDLSGIQFKTLSKKKGPAVQATRAQTDKDLYEKTIQKKIAETNMQVFDDEIVDFEERSGEVIVATGTTRTYHAKAFVLTTGTFLNGSILIGDDQRKGGRIDENSAAGLEKFFYNKDLKLGLSLIHI